MSTLFILVYILTTPKKIILLRECYTSILKGFIMKEIIKDNITISITILFVRGEREVFF
jgi:hypothetical protein